ncbi:MAG TPA: KTSC domain-containing protein [Pseudomonadales bacterium]|nr:KTSC domain-containing protein [Pseudomonadales bacterium]
MILIAVNSSAVAAVGFDGYTLFVQFHTSDIIYEHHGCPYSLFEAFMNSTSMGEFYNHYIRGKFQ